ncbi:MAG: response regulator [Campylobacterota bacterium]|nr:response regulator [Campylobacterota bacterium]
MGIFSFFSSNKSSTDYEVDNHYFDMEFFQSIVDSSSSMMLYFSPYEGWIGANRTFFETMGYQDISAFNAKYESVRDMFLSESEEIFTESDKSWLDYIRKYHSSGYRITLLKNKSAISMIDAISHSHGGGITVLELKDVTNLHNAKLKTKEVETLKTKFLANIGHEFRTPMNGILGFIELIEHTQLDKRQKEFIGMISHSSKNLMTNIESLLDLSQLQGGRLLVHNQEFNILPDMEELAHNFCIAGKEKGVGVLTFIDPKLPKELSGDIKKINQVIFSIVQNAVKFTPRGGKVIIEVKLLKRQKNGDCSIGFGVRDNGQGISHEQISRISEPFTSGSQADERLGVGLSLSYGLVNLLGSELKIQSQPDEGTYVNYVLDFKASKGQNFKMIPKRKVKVLLLDQTKVDEANFLTIYLRSFAIDVVKSNMLDANVYDGVEALYIVANQNDSSWMLELGTYSKKTPIILVVDQDEQLQTKLTHIVDSTIVKPLLPSSIAQHLYAVKSIKPKKSKNKRLNISPDLKALVVEDNIINQRLVKILLQEHNISVWTATNGNEAVEMCQNVKYDIILMDIDMPKKNGIEATKEIKNGVGKSRHSPVIALTAMAMEGDREMLMKKGLDEHLPKPLNRDKFEKFLNKYLKATV